MHLQDQISLPRGVSRRLCPMTSADHQGLQLRAFFFPCCWMLALLLVQGCSSGSLPDGDDRQAAAHSSKGTSASLSNDTIEIHRALQVVDSELSVLKTHFTYRKHNLPVPSYYHRNWWDNYSIHDNALMAGVDSAGQFFLIDSYNCSMGRWPEEGEKAKVHRMEDCNAASSRLELRFRDTTVSLPFRPNLPAELWPQDSIPIRRDMFISTGYFCTDYYPIPDNPGLVHMLADPNVGYFKFYRYCGKRGYGDVGSAERRDRIGLRECARLSELLLERKRLQEMKAKATS